MDMTCHVSTYSCSESMWWWWWPPWSCSWLHNMMMTTMVMVIGRYTLQVVHTGTHNSVSTAKHVRVIGTVWGLAYTVHCTVLHIHGTMNTDACTTTWGSTPPTITTSDWWMTYFTSYGHMSCSECIHPYTVCNTTHVVWVLTHMDGNARGIRTVRRHVSYGTPTVCALIPSVTCTPYDTTIRSTRLTT